MTNEEIIAKVDQTARAEVEKYQTPFIFHYESANQKGLELATKLKADIFVVGLGTRLMDLKIGQALSEGRLKEHVQMSSDEGVKLLSELAVDQTAIQKVKNCIEGHHRDVQWTCKEAEICANADCYRFLLLKNWLQYVYVLNTRQMTFEEAIKQAAMKFEEKLKIITLDEAKQELDSDINIIRQIIEKTKV